MPGGILPPGEIRVDIGGRIFRFLRVSDQGTGIPDSERERLLERFVRLPSAAGVPGTGLGLAIARSLVEMNGGKVRLAGGSEGGTLFEIELPLAGGVVGPEGRPPGNSP